MQKLNVLRNAYMRRFFILNYQYNFSYCHFLTMHICFVKRPPHSKYCKKEINVYTRKTFFQFAYNFDLCKRRQNCLHDLQTRIAWNSSVWDVFSRLVVRCRHIYFCIRMTENAHVWKNIFSYGMISKPFHNASSTRYY